MALFDNEARSASVSALVGSELAVLRRKAFIDVMPDDFTIARRILSTLSGRLRRANDMIESLVLLDVGGRLAGYLLRLARESGTLGEDGWYSVSRPTHQVIANTIGASRETVTRLLRQFEERELIRARGSSVWIRDEPLRTTPSGTHKLPAGTEETPRTTEPGPGKTGGGKTAPSRTAPRKGEGGRRK